MTTAWRQTGRGGCTAGAILLALPAAMACAEVPAAPWWNADHPYRAQIACPAGEGDVAQVTVALAGRTTADGRDLRLVDDRGSMVPFLVAFHDPALQSVLVLRVPEAKAATLWLYYGNTRVQAINTLRPLPQAPAWEPRRGLVLRVYRKAQPGHPGDLAAFQRLLEKSTPEGAAFRPAVSDGFNPFGASDDYLSIYEGWLRIDTAGRHGFCSASADGSWVEVNGNVVLSWPGPHGWGGAERGERNGSIDLPRGVAHVRYFHETDKGPQMAFLGWRPPGSDAFSAIPGDRWLSVRRASVVGYESRNQAVMAVPEAAVLNTYWIRETDGQQATLVEFTSRSFARSGRIAARSWSLGDGLSGSGEKVNHVYFRLGRPEVKLTVADDQGNSDTAACSPRLFLVDVESNYLRYGTADQYAKVVADYDVQAMAAGDLAMLALFGEKLERWRAQVTAAEAYIARFPNGAERADVAAGAADSYLRPAIYDPAGASRMFEAAMVATPDAAVQRVLQLQYAQHLAWNLGEGAKAEALFQQVLEATRRDPPPPEPRGGPLVRLEERPWWRDPPRTALIGLGDVALLRGQKDKAGEWYAQAQARARRKVEQPEALARIGSYPHAVEDFLSRGQPDWALRIVDEWEDSFPTQKVEGYSTFLRGKACYVARPTEQAIRCLTICEQVDPQGVFVPEAVWLRANCLLDRGSYKSAIEQFERLRTEFTRSEFHARAQERIRYCQERLRALSERAAPKPSAQSGGKGAGKGKAGDARKN